MPVTSRQRRSASSERLSYATSVLNALSVSSRLLAGAMFLVLGATAFVMLTKRKWYSNDAAMLEQPLETDQLGGGSATDGELRFSDWKADSSEEGRRDTGMHEGDGNWNDDTVHNHQDDTYNEYYDDHSYGEDEEGDEYDDYDYDDEPWEDEDDDPYYNDERYREPYAYAYSSEDVSSREVHSYSQDDGHYDRHGPWNTAHDSQWDDHDDNYDDIDPDDERAGWSVSTQWTPEYGPQYTDHILTGPQRDEDNQEIPFAEAPDDGDMFNGRRRIHMSGGPHWGRRRRLQPVVFGLEKFVRGGDSFSLADTQLSAGPNFDLLSSWLQADA